MESIQDIVNKINREIAETPQLDLKYIYNQLKGKYKLELTTGSALEAGFYGWERVLTGKVSTGQFYLYFNGMDNIFDYDTQEGIAGRHWHPYDTDEALGLVIDFMEGKII